MKKLFLSLTLCFSALFASATHVAGGEIWYEHDTLASSYTYKVYMKLYRDAGPGTAGLPNSLNICLTSSCYRQKNVQMTRVNINPLPGSDTIKGTNGSIIDPGLYGCVSDSLIRPIETHLYEGVAYLNGQCNDFTFTYGLCCRNNSDNIVNSNSQQFVISAKLDNTHGSNSSPRFVTSAIKGLCLGSTYSYPQSAIEPDGDSLYYFIEAPYGNTSAHCSTGTSLTFAGAYSALAPLTSSTPFSIDPYNGTLTFTPAAVEVVVFRVSIKEYRMVNSIPVLIGEITRDMQIPIIGTCKSPPATWIDLTGSGSSIPTLDCGDSIINVKMEETILANSVAPDGSDFALVNSVGDLVPIIAAEPVRYSGQTVEANRIKLSLHTPIFYNDSLQLVLKIGSDRNTIKTSCGLTALDGTAIPVMVEDCSTAIGVAEAELSPFKLYPNPANDYLMLEYSGKETGFDLTITDLSGKAVLSKSYQNLPETLNVSQLPSGIYFFALSSAKARYTVKFEKL